MFSIQGVLLASLVALSAPGYVLGDYTVVQSQGANGFNFVYHIGETPRNWQMAKADCAAKGLQLATIMDANEQQAITNAIRSAPNDPFWISGSDLGSVGRWYWESTGADWGYTRWFPGEPNNQGEEQCLELRHTDRFWNNDVCSSVDKKYICEGYIRA